MLPMRSRVPGGSSGGSAVAVQANLCTASLETDTVARLDTPGLPLSQESLE